MCKNKNRERKLIGFEEWHKIYKNRVIGWYYGMVCIFMICTKGAAMHLSTVDSNWRNLHSLNSSSTNFSFWFKTFSTPFIYTIIFTLFLC